MKKFVGILSGLILLFSAFCGCKGGKNGEVTAKGYEFYAMNTVATLAVYDDFSKKQNEDKFNKFVAEVGNLLHEIENSISTTKTTSDIYKFNEAAAGATVPLGEHAYNVLNTAQKVYTLTYGYYNPAIYYNVQAYGFNSSNQYPQSKSELPMDTVIEAYMGLYGHFDELEIGQNDTVYYAVKPEYTTEVNGETISLKVDIGGIGKGYAADRVNALMDSYGYATGYFNFGSSSIAIKKYKDGGDYNLGFSNPRSTDQTYARALVSDVCLSTSGDYEQYFLLGNDGDGTEETRYCHVFNPKTGRPIETGIMTATVIGGSAAENDALTTAIMAMGAESAIEFILEKLSDRQVVFTCDDGDGYYCYTNIEDGRLEILSDDFLICRSVVLCP